MTISEIRQLSDKEFAERYPFLQYRKWDPAKREYYKAYWSNDDEAVKDGYRKSGDPVMEFYKDDCYGWNALILAWAEKVREVFINNGDGKIPDDVYVSEIKEKYGSLRICFGFFKAPYEKINDLTYMAEHLSMYICYSCGHIGRSSNRRKLVTYSSRGYWVSYSCKECAKKEIWGDIKKYGIKNDYYKKWLRSNPHFNLYKSIFDEQYERVEGDCFSRVTIYSGDTKKFIKRDCNELLDMLSAKD